MIKALRPLACAFVLLALAIPAGAAACVPTSSEPTASFTHPTSGQLHYIVVDDTCPTHDCVYSLWVFDYVESNGMAGLQRDDLLRDDTCSGRIDPDAGGGPLF